MTQSGRSQIDTLLTDLWAMRIRLFALACVVTSLISCSENESPSLAIVPGPELIHSISEYQIEYQTRAESVANELMQHWPKESYVRWRPVRIKPGEVLNGDFLKSGEPAQRAEVALARGRLGDSLDLCDLAVAELLEVAQYQHLAIDRLHAVERLLQRRAQLFLHRGP